MKGGTVAVVGRRSRVGDYRFDATGTSPTQSPYQMMTLEDIKGLRSRVDALKGAKQEKETRLATAKKDLKYYTTRCENGAKAVKFLQKVAQDTQKNLEFRISNLVSMAEAAVFPDPYEFAVSFEMRRGKTECDLWFVKGGERMNPIDSAGGGACDVASFALRCAFYNLKSKRRGRPIMLLDEPMRNVSVDLQSKCSAMIKRVSEKLGLQIIMISHLPKIIESADKLLQVVQEGGVSTVEEVDDVELPHFLG